MLDQGFDLSQSNEATKSPQPKRFWRKSQSSTGPNLAYRRQSVLELERRVAQRPDLEFEEYRVEVDGVPVPEEVFEFDGVSTVARPRSALQHEQDEARLKFENKDDEPNWPANCPIVHQDFERDFILPSRRKFVKRAYIFWYFAIFNLTIEVLASLVENFGEPEDNPFERVIYVFLSLVAGFFGIFFFHFRLIYTGLRYRNSLSIAVYCVTSGIMSAALWIQIYDSTQIVVQSGLPAGRSEVIVFHLDMICALFLRGTAIITWFLLDLYCLHLAHGSYFWLRLSPIQELRMLDEELEEEANERSLWQRFLTWVTPYIRLTPSQQYTAIPVIADDEIAPPGGWPCWAEFREEFIVPGRLLISHAHAQFGGNHLVFRRAISERWDSASVTHIMQFDRTIEVQAIEHKLKLLFVDAKTASSVMTEWATAWSEYLSDVHVALLPDHISRQLQARHAFVAEPPTLHHEENPDVLTNPFAWSLLSDEDWRLLVSGMRMEPFRADDILVEVGEKLDCILFSSDGHFRIENDEMEKIAQVPPECALGLGNFMARVAALCEHYASGDSSAWSMISQLVDHQETAWIAAENMFVYFLPMDHLLELASGDAARSARIFSWICQMMLSQTISQKDRMAVAAVEKFHVHVQHANRPPTKLRDGREVAEATKKNNNSITGDQFGLPTAQRLVCDQNGFRCRCTMELATDIHRPPPQEGVLYLFPSHIAFKSADSKRNFTVAYNRMVALEALPDQLTFQTRHSAFLRFDFFKAGVASETVRRFWSDPNLFESAFSAAKRKIHDTLPPLSLTPLVPTADPSRSSHNSDSSGLAEILEADPPEVGSSSTSKSSPQLGKPPRNEWQSDRISQVLNHVTHIVEVSNNNDEESTQARLKRLWSRLGADEKLRLFEGNSIREYSRNSVIDFPDPGRPGLFLVFSGRIRQQRTLCEDSCLVVFNRFGPGSIFGIECFMLGQRSGGSDDEFVVDSDEASVLYVSRQDLQSRLKLDMALRLRVFREFALELFTAPATMLNHKGNTYLC